MVKPCITLSSMIVLMASCLVHGNINQDPLSVQEWFKNLPNMTPIHTHLHFYLHDILNGTTRTALRVAQSTITSTSPTSFGFIAMADSKLTTGPQPNSTLVGRSQGIYGSTSFEEYAHLMTMNLFFTGGDYNGSTLSLLGRDPVYHPYREMPIVGGSGVFRMARGVAIAKTYFNNLTSASDIIAEYNVMVVHY